MISGNSDGILKKTGPRAANTAFQPLSEARRPQKTTPVKDREPLGAVGAQEDPERGSHQTVGAKWRPGSLDR